jgi:sugar phosphate isomerase/epimerase
MNAKMKLGVSLFSYSSEYYLKKLTLDDILQKSKEAGAQGIEIVASQMIPGFPYPTKEWLHGFRDRCEKLGLESFCYSAHLDSGLRSDRWLTDDEKIACTVNDLRNAEEMGASVVRTQHSISPELLYRIAPWAEKYRVKVGVEIHPPHRLDTPVWLEFEKAFREIGSPYVGMVLDTGIYQEYPYDGWLNVYAQHGVPQDTIDYLLRELANRTPPASVQEVLKDQSANEYALEMANEMFSLYRPYVKDELEALIKYVTHFHTKFYHMMDGEEKTIPYRSIFEVVCRAGFDGYLISEYEGHYCYDSGEFPSAEQVKAHIAMEKKVLELI